MAQTIDMSKTLNEPYLYKSSFMKDKEMPDKKDTLVKVDSMLEVEGKRNNRFKVLRLTIDTQVYMVRLFSI